MKVVFGCQCCHIWCERHGVRDPKASAAFQWEDFPLSVPQLVSQISQGHLKQNATLILCRWKNQWETGSDVIQSSYQCQAPCYLRQNEFRRWDKITSIFINSKKWFCQGNTNLRLKIILSHLLNYSHLAINITLFFYLSRCF